MVCWRSWSVKTWALAAGWLRGAQTMRRGCSTLLMPRTVRAGSSARMVPAPTRIAPTRARSFMASARAAAEVIHCPSPGGRVRRPSSDIPHLATTQGIPVTMKWWNSGLRAAHWSARRPEKVSIPARAKQAKPRPRCLGLGSMAPTTTRARPAWANASVQGGVRPWVLQGSRVTYAVAPRARSGFFKARSASISACG